MMKTVIIAIVLIVVLTASNVYFIRKAALLESDLANAVISNDSYKESMNKLKKDLQLNRMLLKRRDKENLNTKRALSKLRVELDRLMTNEEKKCFKARVPDIVIKSITSRLSTTESAFEKSN